MQAKYITSDCYRDYYCCPNCDEELMVYIGGGEADCTECEMEWIIVPDYSFEEGRWRNCTTISPRDLCKTPVGSNPTGEPV